MLLNKGRLKEVSSNLAKQEDALHKARDVATILNATVNKQRTELEAEVELGTAFQLQAEKVYKAQGAYLRGQVSFYKGEAAETKKRLAASRILLYAAKRTAKKHSAPNTKAAHSRLSIEAQTRIAAADLSTVIALEAAEDASDKGKAIAKENAKLRGALKQADEQLKELQRKLESTTPWVDILGKKGQRYDIYVIETVLILMSLGSTATDACSAFAVFMQRSYPRLKAGVDYRVPGDWFFKEVAEIIYPLGVAASRKLADECIRMYVGLDGSPRDGRSYFGLSFRLVMPSSYVDDGEAEDVVLNCAAGLQLLPNQLHRTEADATVLAVG